MKLYKEIFTILFFGIFFFGISSDIQAQQNATGNWMQKAREAGIEQSVLSDFQEHVDNQKVTEEQLSSILRSAVSMSDRNLPTDIIVQKALEGFSKGVSGDRIVSVVGQVQQSVAKAATIIDSWMEKPEVREMMSKSGAGMPKEKFRNELAKAASKSIRQNIPSESLDKVFSELGNMSVLSKTGPSEIVAAVGILPDISSSAKNPQAAGEFVVRALKGGFKANELQKLPTAMKMAQQRSQLPAASVIEGVAGQMKGNVPAKKILQNLFNGKVGGGPPGDIPRGIEKNKGKGNGNGNANGN